MKKRVIFVNEHYVDSRENKALKKIQVGTEVKPNMDRGHEVKPGISLNLSRALFSLLLKDKQLHIWKQVLMGWSHALTKLSSRTDNRFKVINFW